MNQNRRRLLTTGLAGSVLLSNTATANALESPVEQASVADIGFCQDMSVHHLQALAMCQRVLGRDTGGNVQAAAAEVLQNQAMEVGQMRAWLTDWNASTVPPTTVMAWMGANNGAGMPLAMMPGYATDAELLELSAYQGNNLGRRWLELMRAHHVGGVMMATSAIELTSAEKVIRLANTQVGVQSYEIAQYDFLLAGQYAI